MLDDYHINSDKVETQPDSVEDRLAHFARRLATSHLHPPPPRPPSKYAGRNSFTRLIDAALGFVRKYAPPIHTAGMALTAALFFIYAHIVALTSRLNTFGTSRWPDVPAPSILVLWHGDAPSLLAAFAKRRPVVPVVIMVAGDPRGDFLALLCRMLGFEVVRGSEEQHGWAALNELARRLSRDACVIITADGGGPARVAKVGAVALASAAGVPIVPLAADCHPAIQENRKWDAARNPLPFCSLTITVAPARRFDFVRDIASLNHACAWLEQTLNTL